MLNFAAYPSPEDIEYFSDIAYSINVNGYRAFLVASLTARFEADDVIKAHILIATCVNLVCPNCSSSKSAAEIATDPVHHSVPIHSVAILFMLSRTTSKP
ncbi:hypothetical protein RB195_003407 [Necator americanus]|uniref:Uncharacterized protein n=1 Tax=Necator americanus TaxID=51031 RepID=A0ABR1DNF6_NECAM